MTIQANLIAITVISVEELIRGRLAQIRKANKPQERVSSYYWFTKTIEFLQDFTSYGLSDEHPTDRVKSDYLEIVLKCRVGRHCSPYLC
ncbi:hypothetical protein PN466_20155 [Roseofilum reptotaenium CS-1145]|uniref:Uncharacterized protein n=1 Tax=Roseofilum reptotaenium AO1-A TaxID=1925591 RepID=A0A1L9QXB2_9CYAN|nr:hypothetical protein [Roseofilum reptotaenium]MDB9519264.1 hypothetical protein [Roseofilum reptotaenium CS-1145]OJJ27237.1 hypothetical protein BI308_01755 [Roseofilum reptotaenium AO1-A]